MISAVGTLKVALVASIVGASLFVAALARAADPVEADIRVRVIHARTGEKKFDAHLDDLKKFTPIHAVTYTIGQHLSSDLSGAGLGSGRKLARNTSNALCLCHEISAPDSS